MFESHRRSIYKVNRSTRKGLSRFIDERTSRFNVCVIVRGRRRISSRGVLYVVTLSIPEICILGSTSYTQSGRRCEDRWFVSHLASRLSAPPASLFLNSVWRMLVSIQTGLSDKHEPKCDSVAVT
jgi:hypothetical protein